MRECPSRRACVVGSLVTLLLGGWLLWITEARPLSASQLFNCGSNNCCNSHGCFGPGCNDGGGPPPDHFGAWYWMRSPEEEKAAMAAYFNRYCIRCHGVDGRGVWDIPGIPDFSNVRWQACRSDAQIARIIIEGRGAVMPTFRGTLTLEEAWAMARYLRTFVPGTEVSRPDFKGDAAPPKK
jgi:hypothetical protein